MLYHQALAPASATVTIAVATTAAAAATTTTFKIFILFLFMSIYVPPVLGCSEVWNPVELQEVAKLPHMDAGNRALVL